MGPFYTQSLHPGGKRCRRHSEDLSCAALAPDAAIAILQNGEDMRPFVLGDGIQMNGSAAYQLQRRSRKGQGNLLQ